MFLTSYNHFRAIAIVFIVTGHCIGFVNIAFDNPLEQTIRNFISGGTFLFLFISGFLFHYVFYNKFQYKKFMWKKIQNILSPYILLGALPVFFYVFMKKDIFNGFFLPTSDGLIYEYFIPTLKYYWTGAFLNAFWYIPFIMFTFLCSPLHIAFIRSGRNRQLLIILPLSLCSIFMHRPEDNLFQFQSILYFTPVYLIGIVCSINKETIYKKLKGKEIIMFLAVMSLAYLQTYSGTLGSYHKSPFEYAGIDLMFLQKIVLCLFFMVWLHRFEHVNNKFLHTLAATSFTIFFIHPFILWILNKFSYLFKTDAPWVVLFSIVISVIAVCIVIALCMRRLFPKRSRNIIGY